MRQVCDQHTADQGWVHLRKLIRSCPAHACPLSPPALSSSWIGNMLPLPYGCCHMGPTGLGLCSSSHSTPGAAASLDWGCFRTEPLAEHRSEINNLCCVACSHCSEPEQAPVLVSKGIPAPPSTAHTSVLSSSRKKNPNICLPPQIGRH